MKVFQRLFRSNNVLRSGFAVCLLVIVLCSVSSCGYELVKEKGVYSGEIGSISVPVFKNKTYEPHISMFVTDAFTQEVTKMGLFQVNKADSQAYVDGTIKIIRLSPYTLSKSGLVTEKRVDLYVEVALIRTNGGLIKRWNFSDYETYSVESLNYEEFNKQNAIRKVAERLARRFSAALLMEY